MADLGADRGILMAERGFQSGAIEAAQLTNVQLTSLAELTLTAADAVARARLRAMQECADKCRDRYWNLDKDVRIKYGLRQPLWASGYSGYNILLTIDAALNSALRGQIPIAGNGPFEGMGVQTADPVLRSAETPTDLMEHLEPMIVDLEARLDAAYAAISQESENAPDS